MMTPEQVQTERLIAICRKIAEARPEQIKRLLKDIASAGGAERQA